MKSDPYFTSKINEIFWSQETIMGIIKIFKIQCFYPPRILNEHWCIYSCLLITPRENWFQYVRRVYATAFNFPCIITIVFGFILLTHSQFFVELYIYIYNSSFFRMINGQNANRLLPDSEPIWGILLLIFQKLVWNLNI